MSNSSNNARWKSSRAADIAWAGWGDSYVVYHRPSGRTHFLNSSSFSLITELLQSERDLEAIAEFVTPNDGAGDRELLRQELLDLLGRLEHSGLIEKA